MAPPPLAESRYLTGAEERTHFCSGLWLPVGTRAPVGGPLCPHVHRAALTGLSGLFVCLFKRRRGYEMGRGRYWGVQGKLEVRGGRYDQNTLYISVKFSKNKY